ncbi:glycosyltransferase family 39 protein [Candidatus Bathyarchaeota archaeon]|nr:glycosyltransferase family 39 protein [Candidatus Bathyarchaeota archaeon]
MNKTSEGKMKINFSFEKREAIILAGLLSLSFLIRLLLFPTQGYANDMNTFAYWFNTAAEHGPRVFYDVVFEAVGWVDYPPFNVYFFWGFGSLARMLSLSGTPAIFYIIKLLPNLFDTATAFLIFMFVRKRLDFKAAMLATALYVFNPAVVFNAAVWGQFDAIYTFFLVLSLMLALASKPELSAVTFTLGILTKPQSVALLPLIAFLIFKKNGWRRLLTSILAGAATLFVVIIPFEWSNPITFLSNIYFGAYGGYEYTSVNAFNTWALGGLWVPDGNLFILGWILFGALTAFTLYVLNKRLNVSGELLVLFSAFMLLFGFFMLPTRIHERYLFPALSILALTFPFLKKTRPIYAVLSFTFFVNQAYVLSFLNSANQFIPAGDPIVLAVSSINLIVFLYVLVLIWDELKGRSWFKISPIKISGSVKEEAKENEHQDRPQ